MRSVLLYSLSRVALFAATAGVLFLAGARGFLLLALAVLISGIVSFVLLSRQRDAVSVSVTERASRMRQSLAEGIAREDDEAGAAGAPARQGHETDPAEESALQAGGAGAAEESARRGGVSER